MINPVLQTLTARNHELTDEVLRLHQENMELSRCGLARGVGHTNPLWDLIGHNTLISPSWHVIGVEWIRHDLRLVWNGSIIACDWCGMDPSWPVTGVVVLIAGLYRRVT